MVDLFMDAGFTCFDTAFVYPGSEAAIKKALVDRYPRDSYKRRKTKKEKGLWKSDDDKKRDAMDGRDHGPPGL